MTIPQLRRLARVLITVGTLALTGWLFLGNVAVHALLTGDCWMSMACGSGLGKQFILASIGLMGTGATLLYWGRAIIDYRNWHLIVCQKCRDDPRVKGCDPNVHRPQEIFEGIGEEIGEELCKNVCR